MRQRWLLLGAATLLALTAFFAGLFLSRPAQPPLPASPPPSRAAVERLFAASLFDAAGKETTLARWRGKPLIVNFWATWCPPCLEEMPLFSRLQERHPEVQFVGIAIDTPENVEAFAASHRFSYPLARGSEGVMSLMTDLGNGRGGLPFTVAMDAAGQVRHIRLGALSESEAERLIASLK
ncbi:MAG: thiol-disulfide isomerase-like thioredoxin [Rhodocyclaceae bacterium]|nr:thiol-disulfide isomerase-like thioredoxin [Rhodocyclaceae bacterium]